MSKPLSERLARGAIVMRDTAQMKTQHPEWLIKEMDQSADLLDEAAALARRVEGSAVGRIEDGGHCIAVNPSDGDSFIAVSKMIGQRVRLVPEVGA